MNKKICVIINNDDLSDYDVRMKIVKIMNNIPMQKSDNIHIEIDNTKELNKGIRRSWLKVFVNHYLLRINTVYVDSFESISNDSTEQNIFIALMEAFEIKVYMGDEAIGIKPDMVYVAQIKKIIREVLKEHPRCLTVDTTEERAFLMRAVIDIMDNLWLCYREVENRK